MLKRIKEIEIDYKFVLIVFVSFAVFASVQAYLKPWSLNASNGRYYTHYNNYIIFKQSFFHLLAGKDLYRHYLLEQWDLYKYSPVFSLLFGIFALLPNLVGLLFWNLVNASVLFLGMRYLPQLPGKTKAIMLLAIALELLTSLQNEQSNALTGGLIILGFALLERKHYWWAAGCIVFSVYIKLFGLVAMALYLFYPHKWKIGLYTTAWVLLLFILPLVVVQPGQFWFLYQNWYNLLVNDHSISDGFSVMGWFRTWFDFRPDKLHVLLIGALLFCLPLLRVDRYPDYYFRLQGLASVLIWVVIFNHRAESATFIIAMSGVVIWYFSQERKPENLVLFMLAFIFTQLAPTDIFPRFIRKEYFQPYVVKAVPCILLWIKLIYDMLLAKYTPRYPQPLPEVSAISTFKNPAVGNH
ncbi:membrane protein [Adhaeribacter aerolatus]|uniref:Membrane protein n=1 Tax=Adhaeribacter aerolatus TaxID=670289 RepID=A0A512B238_9BACT|nr:glycosyltransferase family 87 protein [Adhaeribacter aerolatus]GEO06021.1 membrane protein [Adhaeribacter aerolatus]